MKIQLERLFVLHPFLISIYAILGLYAWNATEVQAKDVLRPLLISIAATILILLIARLCAKNISLASLVTSILLSAFFFYGHLYSIIKPITIAGIAVGRHRYFAPLWVLITFLLIMLVVKKPGIVASINKSFILVFSILLALSLSQIGYSLGRQAYYEFTYEPPSQSNGSLLPTESPSDNHAGESITAQNEIMFSRGSVPPDIYYILLDAYGRSDVLKDVYGVDNSDFINSLKDMGFFVASCSQSNYSRTALSLASTFNMDYLNSLNPDFNPDNSSTAWLFPYVKNNRVRKMLADIGYKTIVFENEHGALAWNADIVYRPVDFLNQLSPFEGLLFRVTFLRVWVDANGNSAQWSGDELHRREILYTLKELPQIPNIEGPKFVFVHLIIPHPPFVFGPNGEIIDISPYDVAKGNIYTKEDYMRGYSDSVIFISQRMKEIVPQLIKKSDVPPIIVIAGDHGPDPVGGHQNSVRNLNAYYIPGGSELLYDHITPVNTFRVIFNTYFNGKFELLPDKSYFSPDHNYFDLEEIKNDCR
jgi:hypothetical protein